MKDQPALVIVVKSPQKALTELTLGETAMNLDRNIQIHCIHLQIERNQNKPINRSSSFTLQKAEPHILLIYALICTVLSCEATMGFIILYSIHGVVMMMLSASLCISNDLSTKHPSQLSVEVAEASLYKYNL